MTNDLLFHQNHRTFSYRVAGILIRDGKILLQHLADDPGHSVPGGHVEWEETNDQTLIREIHEEIGAEIEVHELMYVAEIFFPWNESRWHQICLFYRISLKGSPSIPLEGSFHADEHLDGKHFPIIFTWVPLSDLPKIQLYPENLQKLLPTYDGHTAHFIYHE